MTKVVNTDTLHACDFRTSVHLVMKVAFRYCKDTVFLFEAVEHTEIFLHLLTEKMRHFDSAVAFLCFRRGNHIFVHHLKGKLLVLLFRPEQHFPVFLTAHISHLCGRIRTQLIIAHSMVEYG